MPNFDRFKEPDGKEEMNFCSECGGYFLPSEPEQDICFWCQAEYGEE